LSEPNLFTTKAIKKLLVPLIFEQFMIVLVGLADTMLLSGVNESALAAFSLVDNINLLLTQVFMAIGAGGSIIAAQYLGNRDRGSAENTAMQTFLMVLSVSTLIAVPTALLNGPLLSLLYPGVNPAIMAYGRRYMVITALSYPLYGLYNSGVSMLYAQGYSRLSMLTSVMMNTGKIALNVILINVMKMDVTGAGLATLFSRLIGAYMVTRFLMDEHAPIHFPKPFRFRFDLPMIRRILSVALPSGLENVIFLACKLVIGILIAGYSSAMIAANAAATTISAYISIPANAINLTTITIVSQCIGAGRTGEARQSTVKLQIASYISLFLMSGLVAALSGPLVGMLNLTPEAHALTRNIILLYSFLAVFFWAPAFGLPNSLRAAGDNRFVMYAAVFSVVVLRTGGSFVLGNLMELQVNGIWYAMYLDWIARSVFFVLRFRSGKWERHRLV